MYGIYTEKATANRFASLYATTKFYSYMYLENNDKEKKNREAETKRTQKKKRAEDCSSAHEHATRIQAQLPAFNMYRTEPLITHNIEWHTFKRCSYSHNTANVEHALTNENPDAFFIHTYNHSSRSAPFPPTRLTFNSHTRSIPANSIGKTAIRYQKGGIRLTPHTHTFSTHSATTQNKNHLLEIELCVFALPHCVFFFFFLFHHHLFFRCLFSWWCVFTHNNFSCSLNLIGFKVFQRLLK